MLLILSLLTSYYLQIKRIRAVHETLVSIFAGMLVGLIIRVAPGHLIRELLVSWMTSGSRKLWLRESGLSILGIWLKFFDEAAFPATSDYPELGL